MAKLKLGAVTDGKDKNRYCGPSVISAVTDLTTGEAARLIRKQGGRKAIVGTYDGEIIAALRACNIEMTLHYHAPPRGMQAHGITLAAWLKKSKEDRTAGRVFLISGGNHWQLVSGRRYTCGRVREIVSIKDKRVKRRTRVKAVYELVSDNVTKPAVDVSKPKDQNALIRAKARRIAKEIGVELWADGRDDMACYPPCSVAAEEDPYEGSHTHLNWKEVLEMLEDYKKIVGQKAA